MIDPLRSGQRRLRGSELAGRVPPRGRIMRLLDAFARSARDPGSPRAVPTTGECRSRPPIAAWWPLSRAEFSPSKIDTGNASGIGGRRVPRTARIREIRRRIQRCGGGVLNASGFHSSSNRAGHRPGLSFAIGVRFEPVDCLLGLAGRIRQYRSWRLPASLRFARTDRRPRKEASRSVKPQRVIKLKNDRELQRDPPI